MLKTFSQLLGDDIRIFHRYIALTVIYAMLCGLSIVALAFMMAQLMLGNTGQLVAWVLFLLIALVVCWWLRRIVEQTGIQVGIAVLEQGRLRLGNHVAALPVGWFTPQNTAQFNHIVTQGMMSVAQLPAHVFTPLITGIVTPIVILMALFTQYGLLAMIALLALPLMALAFKLTAKIAHYTDQTYQQDFAETSQRIVEFAQAQSVLRAFNAEGNSTRFVDQAIHQQRQSGFKLILLSALSTVLNTWVIQIVFAVLFIVAITLLGVQSNDQILMSEVVAVSVALLLLCRFIDGLMEVAGYSEVLRGASGQLATIQTIFSTPALPEVRQRQVLRESTIRFDAVSFRYPTQTTDVLQQVSLEVAEGTMTALIGASGSGKSTLVKLAARFFDVNQGQVFIGGVDVKQMPYAQLTEQITQIFQDNYLFAGTIADNIRMGRPEATEQQIQAVVEQVGIAEMLVRLPDGLDTMVGEGGAQLSGGERQRIAIARALIKDAPIILVDEATAALDAENQAIICNLLNKLRGKKTILVIAHQLSTIVNADHIAVLAQGRIVEHGTPAQLQELQGHFAHFLQQSRAVKGWQIAQGRALEVTS